MKINIIQLTICLGKLDDEVRKYEIINNQRAYLIMNQDTADSLAAQFNLPCAPRNTIGIYKGNKIFIDNDLKYGDVEIR